VSSLPFALPDIGDAEVAAVVQALRSGWLSSGPRVREFEQAFARACSPHTEAVAVNSATAGLHLALEALGVGPGMDVMVPVWTFTATAEVIVHVGARPVFVDSDPHTLNINVSEAADRITPHTRAILPVHFAGLAVSYAELDELASVHELAVVEDAAHAFPATSDGTAVGAGASAATVFSFYATKTITTGEGGMVVTRDRALANRIRTLRLHGIDRDAFHRGLGTASTWRYDVTAAGFKYNLSDPAAALGLVQLARAEQMRRRREEIALRYVDALSDLPVTLPPMPAPGDVHAWHLFVIRLADDAPISRDELITELGRLGIACSVHFIPLHLHTYWRDHYGLRPEMFPVATREAERVVSLPLYSRMRDRDVERVVDAVRKVLLR